MTTHKMKLHVIAAVAACASIFYVGCGDDDNATPSNRGGASGTSGGSSSMGGAGTTGGRSSSGGRASTLR